MERQLPKNVRQIGNVSDNPKIYVEDYVDTYLNQLREKAKEQPIGVILAGEVLELEDEKAVFVSGAVQMQELSEKDGKLEIGQDGMKHMMEEAAQYFPESHIVGWGIVEEGNPMSRNREVKKIQEREFGQEGSLFLWKNAREQDEIFYAYKFGELMQIGGHYIYYEKNEPMQSYLIDQNQNRSIENGESVPDRAVSDFRKMIEEKSGEEPEHDHRKPILYAMTACAAAALLVTVTQKYGDALPFPGKTKEQTVAVAGNVQGEKTQTAESAAEASAAEEGNTGENTSTPESTGTELETENESGSAAVSEEQNLSGTDPAGSGAQSTSGGEQTGAAENNTGTAQTDPAPGAEPSSAPGTASGSETAETAAQVWQEYTVQKGDSLSKISERYYGTMSRVKDICELNQIAVEDLIYAGQKIYLPK